MKRNRRAFSWEYKLSGTHVFVDAEMTGCLTSAAFVLTGKSARPT